MKKLLAILIILGAFLAGFYAAILAIESIKVEKEIIEKKEFIGEESIVPAVMEIFDAVVLIEVTRFNTVLNTGTGFVYKIEDDKAYIITNYHVIERMQDVVVVFANGDEKEGEIVGYDLFTDLAILTVDSEGVETIAKLGNSQDVEIGEQVFTVGSPLGREYMGTVTKGILSARERLVETTLSGQKILFQVLQTDAAINPGNSGGPLVNDQAEVIGVNSLKIVKDTIEGIGFAIPIENALKIIEVIEKGERIVRPLLGIMMVDASDKTALYRNGVSLSEDYEKGVVIIEIEPDSDAEKGGLERHDVVLKLNDVEVNNSAHFRFLLYKNNIGDLIELEIIRKEENIVLEIELTKELIEE